MALCPGLPRWAGTRNVKPIWILLKQETVSGSGISWTICKSAHRSRQITTPAPHHSVFIGRMPFLPPNQQCQSTDRWITWKHNATIPNYWMDACIKSHHEAVSDNNTFQHCLSQVNWQNVRPTMTASLAHEGNRHSPGRLDCQVRAHSCHITEPLW